MNDYAYDQGWHDERARLAGIEALWDPGTQQLLAPYAGGRVLEAGAGGGSVVSWLAERAEHVLAVDLDTRFVDELAGGVVEVRQLDLVSDPLPAGEFDLVHCRMVLEHLSDREAVLAKLVAALRPGGTIVIEDYDWTSFGFDPAGEAELRVGEGILGLMAAAGFDREYGRRLVSSLSELGLGEVRGEGRSLVIDDVHPGFAFFRLSFEQLAPAAVGAGLMTQQDADAVGGRLHRGDGRIITPTLVAGLGRKPVAQPQ